MKIGGGFSPCPSFIPPPLVISWRGLRNTPPFSENPSFFSSIRIAPVGALLFKLSFSVEVGFNLYHFPCRFCELSGEFWRPITLQTSFLPPNRFSPHPFFPPLPPEFAVGFYRIFFPPTDPVLDQVRTVFSLPAPHAFFRTLANPP